METPNYRKGSIIFDDDTILQVEQRGGGGSGVGGENGLAAVNLKTGESTNAALAEKDETIAEQAGTIEQQEATIETQAATISDLEDEVAAKQATIETQAATIIEKDETIAEKDAEIAALEAEKVNLRDADHGSGFGVMFNGTLFRNDGTTTKQLITCGLTGSGTAPAGYLNGLNFTLSNLRSNETFTPSMSTCAAPACLEGHNHPANNNTWVETNNDVTIPFIVLGGRCGTIPTLAGISVTVNNYYDKDGNYAGQACIITISRSKLLTCKPTGTSQFIYKVRDAFVIPIIDLS